MAYGYFKDLAKKTASDRVLRDKAFNIAKNPKYDAYQRGFDSTVYKLFDKKTASPADKSPSGSGMNNWLKNYINQLLKNFKKGKYIHHSETILELLI